MSRQIIYRLIYIPSLLGLVAMVFLFGHPLGEQEVYTPATMKTFVAQDRSFRIDYPKKWEVTTATMNGTGTRAHFHRDEDSEIIAACNLTDSLMVDIARSTSGNMPGMAGEQPSGQISGSTSGSPSGLSSGSLGQTPGSSGLPASMSSLLEASGLRTTPLEAAHHASVGYLKGKFRHFEEAKVSKSELAGGEALTSTFIAKTDDFFNSKEVVGKHITVLIGNRPVVVDAYAPKGQEEGLYKALDLMLKTLRVSENGG